MTTERSRGNCLFWALRQLANEGGYIAMRKSREWRFVPHFIWSPDLQTWRGFAPVDPKHGPLVGLVKWWFLGEVKIEEPR